jgi:outer membrane protein assembly factor BamB
MLKSSYPVLGVALRLALAALTLVAAALAQMGNGHMGNGPVGNGQTGNGPLGNGMMGPGNDGAPGQGAGMGSMAGGMTGAMGSREMMDGPAVGPDGTAYVLRSLPVAVAQQGPGPAQTVEIKHELMAVNARDGSPRWKLELSGTMLSDPALAADGKLFLTASDTPMYAHAGATTTPRKARLIVVTTDLVSARITRTVEVESDFLSAPKVAAEGASSYVVYATGWEMDWNDNDTVAAGEKYLYAFNSDGSLRFKLKLSSAQPGLVPR